MINKQRSVHRARLKKLKKQFRDTALRAFENAERQERHLFYATELMEIAQMIHLHEGELKNLEGVKD